MATITIKHRDGTTIGPVEMTKPITVTASAGILLQPSTESLAVACSRDPGGVELFYQRNYNAIVNHENTLDSEGNPEFTFAYTDGDENTVDTGLEQGTGYYISRINGALGLGGAFHIVGGDTFRWSPTTNGIAIDDIGRPDVDCSDYLTIAGYLETLKSALDSIRGQVGNVPVASGSMATTFGVHKQYQSVVHLWNYLVYRMAVLFEASFQSNAVYFQGTFINTADVAVNLETCTIGITLAAGIPNGTCSISTRIRATSSEGAAPSWAVNSEDTETISLGTAGTFSWRIDAPTDGTQVIQPRQQVVFTARVDIYIPSPDTIPDQNITASLSWPVNVYNLSETLSTITIVKERPLFLYQESV